MSDNASSKWCDMWINDDCDGNNSIACGSPVGSKWKGRMGYGMIRMAANPHGRQHKELHNKGKEDFSQRTLHIERGEYRVCLGNSSNYGGEQWTE